MKLMIFIDHTERRKLFLKDLEGQLKATKRELDALQTDLVALMGEALIAESDGLRITRYCARGSLDYPALLKAQLPDLDPGTLEQYRRPASERVRVSVQADPEKASIGFDPQAVAKAADHAVAKDFWF